ncbi:MAG: hypothetical protein RLZZ116_944 [Planctomycetota bacterium]|jgi:hypothetical protein
MSPRSIAEWFVQGDVPRDAGAMTLVFERPMPAWAWLLVGVGLFLIALWSYRRLQGTGKPLSRAMRGFLVVLRASVLMLVAFLIAGPSLRFERSRIEADKLVVLLDRSRSLAIADGPGGESREQQLRGFLGGAQPVLDRIAGMDAQAKPEEGERRGKDIDFVGFSGGAFSLGATGGKVIDALGTPEGERTDLDAAIRQAITRSAGQPLSGVLLVSDGRSAAPVSPETLRLLERDAVRVFAVALGSNDRIGDAAIVSAESPARAFVRDRVPVEVRVERGGVAGKLAVRLVDAESGAEIARKEIDDAAAEQTVVLDASTDRAGGRTWRAELVSDRADLVRENDARELSVELIDRPLRVLYVEGVSRWEYRYFKNLLMREKDVESSIMLLSADRDFAQEGNMPIARLPRTKEEFAKYDLFVIGDVPSGFFSPDQLAVMRAEVSERGAGLLWIAGERSTPASWESTPLADLFPFRPPLALEARVGASIVRPTSVAERLGVLRLSDDDDGWPDVLTSPDLQWPRLRYVQSVPRSRLKPTAEVLAEAEGTGAGSVEPTALIARMRFGAGEVVFVATDEIWRWRYGQGERYPERFWVPIVRMLARESLAQGDERATLSVEPPRAAPGESVVVTLRFSDEETAKSSAGSVPVEVVGADGAPVARLELAREGGSATATMPVEKVGAFRAVASDPAFGSASAAFEVVRRDDELRRGDADHAALAELARRTGGEMLDASTIAKLPELLPRRARETDESVLKALWDTPAALTLVLLLLGFEWIGRRILRLV